MKLLYLTPMGFVEESVFEAIEVCLWHTFSMEIRRAQEIEIPDYSYDSKRKQYSSIELLKVLNRNQPKDAFRVLGVTDKDLFIPVLSFVYGHAQFEGKVGIISLARLRQEFYGFAADHDLLITRALKEAVHETGHMFGLTHCNNVLCPMTLSTNIRSLDRKKITLCEGCSILLKENMVEKF